MTGLFSSNNKHNRCSDVKRAGSSCHFSTLTGTKPPRVDHAEGAVYKGTGHRRYLIQLFCHICNSYVDTVFVPGWGNVIRCSNCLIKLASRRDLQGRESAYFAGRQL